MTTKYVPALLLGMAVFLLFFASASFVFAGELVKEAKGECHYQCQNTNTTGGGATTCTPTNAELAAVENKHEDPLHKQCEQDQCGTASYSGSGGSGQEDRCKEMPGMPPMLPMPMPKMPMPKPDECMDPAKAGTKECRCKKPENADDPECEEGKATTELDIFGKETEQTASKSIVDYGKSLFDRLFNTRDGDKDADESGNSTTVRDVTGQAGATLEIPSDPETFRSLQPPVTSASPSLNNSASDNSFISTNTFGVAAQDFEARAQVAEAPGGIVSRIGDAARQIINNLRRFFGIGG